MKILSFIAIQLFFFSGLVAQLAGVDSDYKSERIKYLKSELNLSQEQVAELTLRFKEIIPEKSAADWKKTRMAYEQILLEVLNIRQQEELGERYGFNHECLNPNDSKFLARSNNKLGSEKKGLNNLALSPNPTSDYVTLSYEIGAAGNITLELIDEQGKTIDLISQGYMDKGSYTKRLDMTTRVSNIYYVTLRSEKEIITEKLILQN